MFFVYEIKQEEEKHANGNRNDIFDVPAALTRGDFFDESDLIKAGFIKSKDPPVRSCSKAPKNSPLKPFS